MASTKKTRRGRILAIIGVLLIAAAAVTWFKLQKVWNKPLGAALEMPTATASPVAEKTIEQTGAVETVGDAVTATPTAQPYCGGPQTMYILAAGIDNRADNYEQGLADVIRVARVDFTTPKVTVLSVPRDIWVEIPDISDHYGIDHGKVNQAYFYGGNTMGYYDGPGEGAGLLARTLALNFGFQFDHYGVVNMSTFVKIVDAVGGIDIYLEQGVDGTPIDDTTEDMGVFPAGQQHLDGQHALNLSRVRKRYNDLVRADNQSLVLCALKEKLTSAEVLPKIPDLVSAFQGSVQTDLSPAQISQLACLAPYLKKDNLVFLSLPEDIFSPSRVWDPVHKIRTFVYDVDFNVIRDYVQQFMNDTWVDTSSGTVCP